MKARVKETGEIVECSPLWEELEDNKKFAYQCRCDQSGWVYDLSDLEFLEEATSPMVKDYIPDYWTRLEHQYAGMAMQGLMSYVEQITPKKGRSFCDEIVDISAKVAHALVEKMREERK